MIENAWVAWLILLLPLAAFVIIGLLGRWLRDGSGYVAVAAMLCSLVLSLCVFVQVLAQGALGGNFAAQTIAGYVWLPSIPGNEIRISLLIDNLSSLMLVLVSFLCLLIFIYSLGYMHEEEGKPRYYAEVSLFATGMLGTVSADNFLQLLIFWVIMGLCSYLLIGFWYHKPEAAAAAKKAFLVTRGGDVLFLVGVLVLWNEFGTLRFNEIAARTCGRRRRPPGSRSPRRGPAPPPAPSAAAPSASPAGPCPPAARSTPSPLTTCRRRAATLRRCRAPRGSGSSHPSRPPGIFP